MTVRKLPWYKRNPRDWIEATRELTLEERGAYNDLIELMYLRHRPIPDDLVFVANFLRIHHRRWKAIRKALLDAGRLVARGDYLSDERFERERNVSADYHHKAVTWGRKGGQRRAEQAARDRQGRFDLSEAQNGGNPRSSSKATLGETPAKAETANDEQKSKQNQRSAPRVALDDLDDSFLHEKTVKTRMKHESFTDALHESFADPEDKNRGNPPPSSKPVRGCDRAQEGRKIDSKVRDSSVDVGGGSGGRKGKPRKKSKRAKPLGRWTPEPLTEACADIVAQWPPGMLERELDRFRDHAAMNGRTLKDWNAGWRNWIRKADDDRQHKRNRTAGRQGWGAVADRVAGQRT